MKKPDILQLVASTALLIASIINLVESFVEIPLWVSYAHMILLLVALILYPILFVRLIKTLKQKKNN